MLRTLIDDFIQLSKNKSVREFVVKCGYTKNEDLQITDGRDTFINIDNKVYTKEDSYYFNFCTESAWIPNTGIFQKIIEEKFNDDYEIKYCSEEPGMGIYINTDTDGFFFTDRYYLDCCINGEYHTEYYENKENVLEWIKERFPEVEVSVDYEIPLIEEEVRKYIDETGDDFFSLYEFSSE